MDQGTPVVMATAFVLAAVVGAGLYIDHVREQMRARGELHTPMQRRQLEARRRLAAGYAR
jgi:hypothetical protein